MPTRERAEKVVEYGIRTPHSKTTLMLTEDLAEAERTLDMLGQGTLIERTVSYGPWHQVDDKGLTATG